MEIKAEIIEIDAQIAKLRERSREEGANVEAMELEIGGLEKDRMKLYLRAQMASKG